MKSGTERVVTCRFGLVDDWRIDNSQHTRRRRGVGYCHRRGVSEAAEDCVLGVFGARAALDQLLNRAQQMVLGVGHGVVEARCDLTRRAIEAYPRPGRTDLAWAATVPAGSRMASPLGWEALPAGLDRDERPCLGS